MAKISVIVPVYNTELYLTECLDSLANQTLKDIEIICIDDGSTDNSLQILNSYSKKDVRFKTIHKENGGVVSARITGLELAESEFVCFVDSDDWIELDMLEVLYKSIGDLDLVSCGFYRYLSEDRVVEMSDNYDEGIYDTPQKINFVLEKMIYDLDTHILQSLTVANWNKLFRKEMALNVMNEIDREIFYGEDAVFLYKYILKCKSLRIIKKCYYHYRYREGSVVRSVKPNMLMNLNKYFLNLQDDFKKHELRDILCKQLQCWITFLTITALNEHMGFDKNVVSIPEFIIDTGVAKDKRVILYGAGKAGQDAYKQLMKFDYNVIGWVDKNFDRFKNIDMKIESPERVLDLNYDIIMLMANDERIAKSMEKDLLVMGVQKEKIIWKKPIRVF